MPVLLNQCNPVIIEYVANFFRIHCLTQGNILGQSF